MELLALGLPSCPSKCRLVVGVTARRRSLREGDEDEDDLDSFVSQHMDSSGHVETFPPKEKATVCPTFPFNSKRRRFYAFVSAHLVLSDDPHAATAAPVGGLEDDGEAVGLRKHLRVLEAGDGGIRSRDNRHT